MMMVLSFVYMPVFLSLYAVYAPSKRATRENERERERERERENQYDFFARVRNYIRSISNGWKRS